MIVVSDASPLITLSRLNRLDILPALYGSVFIPPDVYNELTQRAAKIGVADAFAKTSQWLHIQAPLVITSYPGLHPGETAAIALAKELNVDLLIIDEKSGRKFAAREQVKFIGTIGVFEDAADAGLLDLASTFSQLKPLSFHVTQELLAARLKAFDQRQALKRAADDDETP
jgi:predicted nucleic acid-binding protein